jgi:AraC-like DNA-binding protein
MLFQFGLFSSLLLVFFVHGLVYSFLLLRKGIVNQSSAEKWLSLFIFLCVLFIAPWMLGWGGWYNIQPYRDVLFYMPMQHLFFMGPVIFFYVKSLLNPSFKFGKNDWIHLLPGLLYLLYSVIMFVTDKIILKRYYFLEDGSDRDFDTWYQYAGLISMLFYFFISLRYYRLYKKLMVQVISYSEVVLFKWVERFLIAFLLMQLLKVSFGILSIYFVSLNTYEGSAWFFLAFAIVFYYIAITGYSNAVVTKVPFKINLLPNKPVLLLGDMPITNNDDQTAIQDAEIIEIETIQPQKKEDPDFVASWKPKITALLQEEKIYENAELSLSQMAKMLKTNASVLSKMINQGFDLNFNDFINYYRIEAVKEKIKNGEQKTQTLLGIAYDCGFNSKATFNRAFKKATNQSPKDWIEAQ